jgi:hypothetical protein
MDCILINTPIRCPTSDARYLSFGTQKVQSDRCGVVRPFIASSYFLTLAASPLSRPYRPERHFLSIWARCVTRIPGRIRRNVAAGLTSPSAYAIITGTHVISSRSFTRRPGSLRPYFPCHSGTGTWWIRGRQGDTYMEWTFNFNTIRRPPSDSILTTCSHQDDQHASTPFTARM